MKNVVNNESACLAVMLIFILACVLAFTGCNDKPASQLNEPADYSEPVEGRVMPLPADVVEWSKVA